MKICIEAPLVLVEEAARLAKREFLKGTQVGVFFDPHFGVNFNYVYLQDVVTVKVAPK